MKILVTGASGFVGSAVCERLRYEPNVDLRLAVRSRGQDTTEAKEIATGDIGPLTRWEDALRDVDVVVHLAARVHMMDDSAIDPLAEYRRVNVGGTLNLADQAARAGVSRFVFLSSIKVYGERSLPGRPFAADDDPSPEDAYGYSKYEAEVGLRHLAKERDFQVTIIRPPLVYGPGVGANFLAMLRWIHKGWPLPFPPLDNRRSFVARDNLVELIRLCCFHPQAANQIFLVSDGEDVSTTDLAYRMGLALGMPVRFVPVPVGITKMLARFAGKQRQLERILSSLQVDIGKTHEKLGWIPTVTMEVALDDTVRHYLDSLPQ